MAVTLGVSHCTLPQSLQLRLLNYVLYQIAGMVRCIAR